MTRNPNLSLPTCLLQYVSPLCSEFQKWNDFIHGRLLTAVNTHLVDECNQCNQCNPTRQGDAHTSRTRSPPRTPLINHLMQQRPTLNHEPDRTYRRVILPD